jgi:protein-S-isoprenylcysteine O-methyltransferase Ste14
MSTPTSMIPRINLVVSGPFLPLHPVWYCLYVAEETNLLTRYGAPYEEYLRRVGFWIPKIQPSHKAI